MGPAKRIIVLDLPTVEGRRLSEHALASAFEVHEVANLDQFAEALNIPTGAVVGLVAFECLMPDPQRQLRRLREQLRGVRLAVVHAENSPRLRLGQRLWAVGLMDYFISRALGPHEVGPILKQAYADAVIERATEEEVESQSAEANRLHHRMRFLHNLGAAFTAQTRVEGLLRELQSKLPSIIDFQMLGVLVTAPQQSDFYIYQSRPAPHEYLWQLAELACGAVHPFVDSPIVAESLVFHESTSTGQSDETEAPIAAPSSETVLTVPMVLHGELIGCIALLGNQGERSSPEDRTILQLVAFHLSAALHNARILRAAEDASLIDELTGASNRRHMKRLLNAEWKRAERYGDELSLVMIDIDHFKRFNDEHGHLVGDKVLQSLSSIIRDTLRDCDHLIRYGGEEFLLLLPQTRMLDAALVVERIRLALHRQPVYVSDLVGALQITFSAGVGSYPTTTAESDQALIDLADKALLHAKQTGRNRICLANGASIDTFDEKRDQKPIEKRRFPRVDAEFRIKYIPIPDLATRAIGLSTTDVSEGGLAVKGAAETLQKNSYALVYMEDEEKPLLTQVAWTSQKEGTETSAGLRFLSSKDLERPELVGQEGPRKALVVVTRPDTREVIRRVLKAAAFEARFWTPEKAELPEDLSDLSLLIIGETTVRSEIGQMLTRRAKELQQSLRVVVINEENDRSQALDTINAQRIDHLVGPDANSEETLFATLKKIILGNYFGIKKYLLWGVETKTWHISSPERKEDVLTGVRRAAEGVNCHPRIIDLLILAVDEMIINALYHPRNVGGSARPVTVECGSDGRMFAVSVADEYGQFQRNQFFSALTQALESEKTGLKPDAKSASMGFRIMLSALSHLIVNVDPDKCTEIIGLIDLRRSLREHKLTAPGLGMFSKD